MIKSIHIQNFKSLKDILMIPTSLNLLMGLNGMGKSSFIQSLLLLRQNKKSGLAKFALNGSLTEIGRGRDALYQDANKEIIGFYFDLESNGKLQSFPCTLTYQADNNVLDNDSQWSMECLERYSLFNNDFQYLEAERTGPQTDYPMSYADVVEKHQLGVKGEYTIHYLNAFGTSLKVPDTLCHTKAKSDTLLHQTAAWLGEISPDVRFDIQEIPGTDKVILNYQFANQESLSKKFRPKNVGFGISYALPVIVSLLNFKKDKIVIIENPEAHIHPRGQAEMGRLIALAAAAGMQLFVETHSDHIVNGIRVAVKENLINAENVNISYFSRQTTEIEQFCRIQNIRVDRTGELSDYPIDFMDEWNIQQAFSCFPFGRRQADYCSIGWGWFVLFCLLPVFYAVSDKILSFLFCFSSFIITFAVGISPVTYKVIPL